MIGIPTYVCETCGAAGVKLWREYQGWRGLALRCGACACTLNGIDATLLAADGTVPTDHGTRTDALGWWTPAIIDEDGGYWGRTSAPLAHYEHWAALPLTAPEAAR